MSLSEKLTKRLRHIEWATDHICGMYPGDYFEDAWAQHAKLIALGLIQTYVPDNPVHKTRVVITDAGREYLAARMKGEPHE